MSSPAQLAHSIERAQEGDEYAFGDLYMAVNPALLRYLTVLVGSDAEDVAADAWLQIARDINTFKGDANGFRAWAATIARHRAMDHLRRLRRNPAPAAPIEELAEIPSTHDTAADACEAVSTDTALALIASLPRDQAEAVLLRAVMGLDAVSAARILGKRPAAVRTAAHRGLRRLAQRLQEPAAPDSTSHPMPPAVAGMVATDGSGVSNTSPTRCA